MRSQRYTWFSCRTHILKENRVWRSLGATIWPINSMRPAWRPKFQTGSRLTKFSFLMVILIVDHESDLRNLIIFCRYYKKHTKRQNGISSNFSDKDKLLTDMKLLDPWSQKKWFLLLTKVTRPQIWGSFGSFWGKFKIFQTCTKNIPI